ncbi:MAG: class I SAM-dependent methyltransferase [Actinobacteria bacterium]|nr:class I SAM-dependent methyltransferase [Actinomycetota bacterium]
MVHNPSAEAAELGEPSYVWRFGQERRLDLIRRFAPLDGARFLDVGCGIGTYVKRVRELAALSAGIDISEKRLRQSTVPNLVAAVSERLPFADASFDVILLNEVIEHVRDDRETLAECLRVVRPGGHVVIYAPNRLYPFETHGIYMGKRYRFGNIPLVNYLPNVLRDRLVPHAKAYTEGDIRKLVAGLPARTIVHTYVYPGFDNIVARNPRMGLWLRRVLYRAEQNPARRFGLSHFVVLRRISG